MITDHVHNDMGVALAAGQGTNCGGARISLTVLGGPLLYESSPGTRHISATLHEEA